MIDDKKHPSFYIDKIYWSLNESLSVFTIKIRQAKLETTAYRFSEDCYENLVLYADDGKEYNPCDLYETAEDAKNTAVKRLEEQIEHNEYLIDIAKKNIMCLTGGAKVETIDDKARKTEEK